MVNDAFKLNDFNTLQLSTSGGSEEFVAGIQNVTITPTFEYEDLYTADSILREATRRSQASVEVDIGWSLFNVELIAANIGEPGATSTTITNSSDVPLFELQFEIDSQGGDRTLGPVTVEDLRFDDDPPIFDGSADEWVEWSGGMVGKNVTGVESTDNTSV